MSLAPFAYQDLRPGLAGHLSVSSRKGGPRILFVHPANLTSVVWLPLLEHLEARWVAIDLPGHGRSQRLPAYDIPTWSEACLDAMDHAGWQSAHVVGASVGAAIAAHVAAHAPERVESLISIAGAICPLAPGEAAGLAEELRAEGALAVIRRLAHGDPGLTLGQATWVADACISPNDGETAAAIWLASAAAGAMTYADTLRSPTFVVAGGLDVACPASEAAAFAHETQGAFELMPEQGHLPMVGDPESLARLIAHHLSLTSKEG